MELDRKQAARIANFVQFAYNMFFAGGLQPGPDPGIAAAGYKHIAWLNSLDFEQSVFYGYVAASAADPSNLVIAIRGTETPKEWLLDFSALPVPFSPLPDAGFVALGFHSVFEKITATDLDGNSGLLRSFVEKYSAATPVSTVVVTGHSLGAALATLVAAELALVGGAAVASAVQLYTFASPRVGLLDFAATVDKAVHVSFRIWNTLDIVPQTPPFPFIHVSGLGDGIVQTEEQLTTLTVTPACEHHLKSYQWLLDPADFNLETNCREAAVAVAAADALPTPSAVGAHRLRKAMTGRA